MFNQTHSRFQKPFLALTIFTAYAILALLSTWPLVTQLTSHLPGGSDDTLLHYWNGWWVQQALSSVQSPFYTELLFYPKGVSLVTHNMAWFQILPWLLFEPLMGGILAYNVVLLLHLTLAGCALFGLTYDLTGDLRAAFLGGLIYLAWPFRISQLDHPNLLATFCFPLFFLFLGRTIRQVRWRDGLLAGLFFALIGYTRWQLLIPATVMGLVYLLCSLPSWGRANGQRVLARLFLAGGIAVILLLPAMLLLSQEISRENSASLLREGEEAVMQTDLLAYITPAASHPLLGEQTAPLYDQYYHDRAPHRRYTAYIGLVAFLLALLGIWYKRWQSIPWLVMGIILICLALGPLLRVNGTFYENIPTLYGTLSDTFILRLIRVPDRFNMFLALPISVLAAYGASGLLRLQVLHKPRRSLLLVSLLGCLIFVDYLAIPVPQHDKSATDSFYSQLAEEPSDFAILNLPFDPLRSKVYMFNQVTHQRPIVQGNTSRLPDDAYTTIDSNPWLAFLRHNHEMSPALTDIGRQFTLLSQDQIRYLIMHKWFIEDYRIAHWQRYLLTEPRYENHRLVVYSTAPEAGRDFDFKLGQEFRSGLGIIKSLLSTDCLNPNRMLEVDVGWGSRRALEQPFDLVISLVDSTGVIRQSDIYPLSESWPTNQWAANSVAWGYYTLLVEPTLAAGEYTVRLTVLDAASGKSEGESITIGELTVQAESCNFSSSPEAKALNAVFGNNLRLVAYQLEREEGRLDLTLDWRSERRMESDYKIFVHIFDPATGIPVAQDDAMPRRNAYPTTLWWPGEMVDDQITIFLYGVPAGNYGIAIGVYDPVSGQRLQLVNRQNEVIEDGRLILQEQLELGNEN